MDFEKLTSLGLTLNEAKTYVALVKGESLRASELSKRVSIHRSRMYESLDRLLKMGLVSFFMINNIKHYKAEPTTRLLELVKEKEEIANELIVELEEYEKEPNIDQKITAYEGVGGIKTLLKDTLKTKEYVVFGAPEESVKTLGRAFWKNYNQKLNYNKVKTKLLFDITLKDWAKEIMPINKSTEIRFLKNQFDNITETFVFEDKVIIITWGAQPLGVLIKDKDIAKSYFQFFEMLWKQAK